MKIVPALVVVVVTFAGCASMSDAFKAKPAHERAAFQRCATILSERQCPGQTKDHIERAMCINGLAHQFAASADGERWLILNGCPSEMVR